MNEPTEKAARALCEELEIGEHPDLERDLFAFVDGTVDTGRRREIESHLELCTFCRGTVADLRTLARPPRPRWLLLVAASIALIVVSAILLRREPVPPSPSPPRIAHPAAPAPVRVPDAWETLVERVRAGAPIARPAVLDEIREDEDILRGTSTSRDPLAPAGVIVMAAQPELTWPAPDGATSVVQIFRGEDEVARSGTLTTRHWHPRRELGRGLTYAWQVRVTEAGQMHILGIARFHVVDAATRAELAAAERAHPGDHLLLGILHVRAGLDAEARAQLGQVTDPRDAAVARRILDQLEARQ